MRLALRLLNEGLSVCCQRTSYNACYTPGFRYAASPHNRWDSLAVQSLRMGRRFEITTAVEIPDKPGLNWTPSQLTLRFVRSKQAYPCKTSPAHCP
jgi:hypothetical protein